jgi:DNA polymerase II small subunit/DNA polymerase delta subunit B
LSIPIIEEEEEKEEESKNDWMAINEDLNRKIKGIHGTKAERAKKLARITNVISSGIGGTVSGQDLTSSLVLIKLDGLSISVANYDPREIMLLSLYHISLIKFDVSSN